eukprot:1519684-Rhodomonas_salina.1
MIAHTIKRTPPTNSIVTLILNVYRVSGFPGYPGTPALMLFNYSVWWITRILNVPGRGARVPGPGYPGTRVQSRNFTGNVVVPRLCIVVELNGTQAESALLSCAHKPWYPGTRYPGTPGTPGTPARGTARVSPFSVRGMRLGSKGRKLGAFHDEATCDGRSQAPTEHTNLKFLNTPGARVHGVCPGLCIEVPGVPGYPGMHTRVEWVPAGGYPGTRRRAGYPGYPPPYGS